MVTARTDRLDQQLRQEIGEILQREVRDPGVGFATVTDVETAPDLSHARVWVSVIGQPAERRETLRALERAMPFVRRELGTRLHLRRIPVLHFREDDTAERGTRVLRLLAEIEAGETPAVAPEGESLPTPVARLPHAGDAPPEAASEEAAGHAAPAPPRPQRRHGRTGGGRSKR
jgi:ribosome-binding factor A